MAGGCARPPVAVTAPARRLPHVLLVTCLLLGACASLPPLTGAAHSYTGRFSLAVMPLLPAGADAGADTAGAAEGEQAPTGQRTAWSGRFSLAVDASGVALDLVTPLGATIARFETDDHEARLLVPAGDGVRVEHGADAQALSERVMGWSLPLAGMADWVEGRPSAGRPFRRLAADGGSERFEQDGWAVSVEPPAAERTGRRLRMDRAARAGAPGVDLRVVLDGPPA